MLDHPPPIGSHKITFLPLGSLSEMGKKAKFKNLFSIMYFSNRYVDHMVTKPLLHCASVPLCSLLKQ